VLLKDKHIPVHRSYNQCCSSGFRSNSMCCRRCMGCNAWRKEGRRRTAGLLDKLQKFFTVVRRI